MKKKILIVGGSHSEIPLVRAAKALGFYVITTGNQPQGLAHREADEYQAADYADREAVCRLAEKLDIDHICFGAHDLSMISTVYTAQKLGLGSFDTLETTLLLHHKDRFKRFAASHRLATPAAKDFSSEEKALEYASARPLPFVVKPVDLGGGKGIRIVRRHEEAGEAIREAFRFSKTGNIVIEAYFEGSLHSFSTFIVDRKIVFSHADDEYPCRDNPYGVCTSTAPATDFEAVEKKLREETERVAQLLGLEDGLLHLQYLQNGEDIAVVEFTRRMPGDMYNVPVERLTGFPYAENVVRSCCGMPIRVPSVRPKEKYVSRHCIVSRDRGKRFETDAKLETYIFDRCIWGDAQNMDKQGILFLEYGTFGEMRRMTSAIDTLIRLKD